MSIVPGRSEPLAVRSRRVEPGDDDLVAHLPDSSPLAWVRRGEGLVGWGEVARIRVGPGADRFARAERELQALLADAEVADDVGMPGSGPVAFGSFTFDPRSSGSVFVVPRVVLARRGGRAWVTTIGSTDGLTGTQPVHSPTDIQWSDGVLSAPAWMGMVERAVAAIRNQPLRKVVLTRDIQATAAERMDPRALMHRLTRYFPECYTFCCAGLVGATPELLVRRDGNRVASQVLAGTAPRGNDPTEDERLGRGLLASAKDVEEHEVAVASVRATLASRCADLTVDADPSLLVLANVQHLATSVTGTLDQSSSALEIAAALHPTAAVCGTPTETALALIRELEGVQRGRYAGPVGWLDGSGNGEWGVALRCAELDGARARLFAGNGIVAGSRPEEELAETQAKFRAMQRALEG